MNDIVEKDSKKSLSPDPLISVETSLQIYEKLKDIAEIKEILEKEN
jgi:hypothetical protein